jgi:hypothetical protein
MKRIIEERSNDSCASPPESPTHLIPLSVCLSCVFSETPVTPSLAELGSVITRSKRKLSPTREQEKAQSKNLSPQAC